MKKNNKFKRLMNFINNDILLNRTRRKQFELCIVSSVFFLAGAGFTIINFAQNEMTMAYVTMSFAAIALVSTLITIFVKKGLRIGQVLFTLSALIMFVYFLISGGAGDSGFSTYWIIILPFVSIMILGMKNGSIASFLMFLIIITFLWILPAAGINVVKYIEGNKVFQVRFPLVYLAAVLASCLFEWSRSMVDRSNENIKHKLEIAASHDPLTGLSNRYGLSEMLQKIDYSNINNEGDFYVANCVLIDVDNFKSANDNYGHLFGDKVLVEISKVLKRYAGEWAVRFGGDEFILLFSNKTNKQMLDIGENIRKEIENIKYEEHPDAQYTVSVGIASHKITLSYRIDRVIELADAQSSLAKKEGKNRVYILDYKKFMK